MDKPTMPFDCSFDAPMFVDFQNLDGDHQEQEQAEAYFEVDHETDINTETNPPKSADVSKITENLNSSISSSNEGKRDALRRAVSETINEISNSPKPKIPERRKTPVMMKPLDKLRIRLPSPDRNCSPAVTRFRKVVEKVISSTPEILKQARLAKQLKKNQQQETLKHGQGSSGTIDRATTAKMFKEKLAKSRLASAASAPSVVSNMPSKAKAAHSTNTSTGIMKQITNPCIGNVKPYRPLQPTRPAPFHFATDTRIKPDVKPGESSTSKETGSAGSCDPVDFQKMLRTYRLPTENTTCSTTKPHPFKASSKNTESTQRRVRNKSAEPSPQTYNGNKFYQHNTSSNASRSTASSQSKTRTASGESSYLSMAEQVVRFHTGTPDRFRSRPKRRSTSTPSHIMKSNRGRSPSPLRCTQPHTPNLVTRGRTRKPAVISNEQKEIKELEEAKQNQFRARAVGEGVPKPRLQPENVEKRGVTQPEPFNLTSAQNRPKFKAEENIEFHAQPFDRKILNGPVGVPTRNPLPVIVPESPAFALKDRLKDRKRPLPLTSDEEHGGKRIIKARPVPHHGVPVILPNCSKKTTTAEPFSFYDRDVVAHEMKAKKIEAVLEEQKKERQFKANPMPNLDKPVSLPIKQTNMPTQAEPFHLWIEKRVEERKRKWEEDVENELKQQREAAIFKARPARVLEEKPFDPKPSEKPLTEIDPNFQLHSDKRAEEREEYDMRRKYKEGELDAARRQMEERRRHEEDLEIQRMRREAVHKAQPVRHFNPIDIQKCDKPVTVPVTPQFTYVERNKRKGLTEEQEKSHTIIVDPLDEQPRQNLDNTFDL